MARSSRISATRRGPDAISPQPSLPATNAKRLRKGAKRRSNPFFLLWRYGLLRFARNDDVEAASAYRSFISKGCRDLAQQTSPTLARKGQDPGLAPRRRQRQRRAADRGCGLFQHVSLVQGA